MNKTLVLDKFIKMDKDDQQVFLDRIELKIEFTERAYNETKSEVMLEQMQRLYYYFNLGYAYLR